MSVRTFVLSISVALATLAAGCKRAPVTCGSFTREDGRRASLTQLDKSTSTFRWAECSDAKVRVLSCTSGHLHNTKCTCELQDGEHRTEGRVKTDDEIPDDRAGATAFANRWCEFRLN